MKNILIAAILLFTLTNCEKVIDLQLNEVESKYVIEGEITDIMEPYQVKITKTMKYSEGNNYAYVSGAEVIISDNNGNSEKLLESKPGIYITKKLRGIPNNTYYLTVKHDNNKFTATCTMPEAVLMQKLNFEKKLFGSINNSKELYSAVPIYLDPIGTKNYYRFVQTINGKIDPVFLVKNDYIIDGKLSYEQVFTLESANILKGDTLKVQMQNIDNRLYNYFFSFAASLSNSSTIPANPSTNISGGALGYFSACSVSSKTIIIK